MDFNPKNYFLERLGKGTVARIIQLRKEVSTIGKFLKFQIILIKNVFFINIYFSLYQRSSRQQ